jgi:uncharacterized UPF0160 family protein
VEVHNGVSARCPVLSTFYAKAALLISQHYTRQVVRSRNPAIIAENDVVCRVY